MENGPDIAGNHLLTFGSIIKIGLIEFAVVEVILFAFIIFTVGKKKNFAFSINGTDIVNSGGWIADFIAMSIFSAGFIVIMSVLLGIGQFLINLVIPLSFKLHSF